MHPVGLAPSTVAQHLKIATEQPHRALEAQLDLTGPMTLSRYIAVLKGFAAFSLAWEPRMAAALPARLHDFFAPRRRLGWLASDLAVIDPAGPAALPAPEVQAIDLSTLAHAFGSLYVLEGSTLGGQVIGRHVSAQLGLKPDHGLAYFHGHGAETGALWKNFRMTLETEVGPEAEAIQRAICAAQQTFGALAAVFGRTA